MNRLFQRIFMLYYAQMFYDYPPGTCRALYQQIVSPLFSDRQQHLILPVNYFNQPINFNQTDYAYRLAFPRMSPDNPGLMLSTEVRQPPTDSPHFGEGKPFVCNRFPPDNYFSKPLLLHLPFPTSNRQHITIATSLRLTADSE
jgi:hypothetical protein